MCWRGAWVARDNLNHTSRLRGVVIRRLRVSSPLVVSCVRAPPPPAPPPPPPPLTTTTTVPLRPHRYPIQDSGGNVCGEAYIGVRVEHNDVSNLSLSELDPVERALFSMYDEDEDGLLAPSEFLALVADLQQVHGDISTLAGRMSNPGCLGYFIGLPEIDLLGYISLVGEGSEPPPPFNPFPPHPSPRLPPPPPPNGTAYATTDRSLHREAGLAIRRLHSPPHAPSHTPRLFLSQVQPHTDVRVPRHAARHALDREGGWHQHELHRAIPRHCALAVLLPHGEVGWGGMGGVRVSPLPGCLESYGQVPTPHSPPQVNCFVEVYDEDLFHGRSALKVLAKTLLDVIGVTLFQQALFMANLSCITQELRGLLSFLIVSMTIVGPAIYLSSQTSKASSLEWRCGDWWLGCPGLIRRPPTCRASFVK